MTVRAVGTCRSCGADAVATVLDLGRQPVADDLAVDAATAREAPRHRLALGCCGACALVQLDPSTPVLPAAVHGHGGAFSGTVQRHEQAWAEELAPLLGDRGRVLDAGSGSAGLLHRFRAAGHRVEVLDDTSGGGFDLVVASHTLSHADDLDGELALLAEALAPDGTLAVEFHSALGILTGGQVDVVCHAHRSYLSLTALAAGLARHGLTVTTARTLPLHGGVVRVQARRGSGPDDGFRQLLAAEHDAGLGSAEAWAAVAERAGRIRAQLVAEVAGHVAAGRTIAGYGAPSRGTTLLNWAGLGAAQIPRTADRSPAKQGRFLPGAGTLVCTPDELVAGRPDVVVVLVWPLRAEVLAQLDGLRRAGTRFLFPLPAPELVA